MRAIGLMSGTSLDGIDASILETDGKSIFSVGPNINIPYDNELRMGLKSLLGKKGDENGNFTRSLTLKHAEAVFSLLSTADLKATDIDVVGFHGQTIFHDPTKGITCQIGNGKLLADIIDIVVISDFRSNDVAKGGQGAPLAPVYHAALTQTLELPIAILNLGGVANVTWIGADGSFSAFDTGPGNALIDDWITANGLGSMDRGGNIAASGSVCDRVLNQLLMDPYFKQRPPKSLDRNHFSNTDLKALSVEDGAATLAKFTAQSVAKSLDYLDQRPTRWLVSGGGRYNLTVMKFLSESLGSLIEPIENAGWDGDGLEAQAFAFLAVRSLLNLPISFPNTTGVKKALTGGVCNKPEG